MPKIFLIKDRLLQQQERLQETLKASLNVEESPEKDSTSSATTLDLRKPSSSPVPFFNVKDEDVTLDLRTTSRTQRRTPSPNFLFRSSSPVEKLEEDKPLSLTIRDKGK